MAVRLISRPDDCYVPMTPLLLQLPLQGIKNGARVIPNMSRADSDHMTLGVVFDLGEFLQADLDTKGRRKPMIHFMSIVPGGVPFLSIRSRKQLLVRLRKRRLTANGVFEAGNRLNCQCSIRRR